MIVQIHVTLSAKTLHVTQFYTNAYKIVIILARVNNGREGIQLPYAASKMSPLSGAAI